MIQISLTTALIVYSALLGAFMLGIWVYTELSTRRAYQFLERQFLWRCVFCGYTYLDEEAETVSRCPRCESFNSIEDKHARLIRRRTTDAPFEEPSEELSRNTSHRKRPNQRRRGPRKRR